MKLGLMANSVAHLGWDGALRRCRELGIEAIEIPCGCYPKRRLLEPERLVDDEAAVDRIRDDLERYGIELSALGCNGNAVHPNPEEARRHVEAHDRTVRLAAKLGVKTVVTFSGCPGGGPEDRTPNWVTCVWPPEYSEMLVYQWEKVLIPFWKRKAEEAGELGVRIALEMHPGFAAYNPETVLRLRDAAGPNLGANLDPSHLFWQGIDPVEAARVLGEANAIFNVHAKDTRIDPHNTRRNGVLDTKSYGDLKRRSWVFRTCGWGHDDTFWRSFFTMLRVQGYDGAISVEHEDAAMSAAEGLEKGVAYVKELLLRQPPDEPWWF